MIRINNRDEIEWEEGMTAARLLERMNYTFPHVIVTVDGKVVPPGKLSIHPIPDGADVKVIHLVAGG